MDKKVVKDFGDFVKLNENVTDSVRVRYAPSPTSAGQHVGGVRTALYNYLFAKKYNGKFIMRLEDTDQSRFVPEAEKNFMDVFDWLGIEFDESPSKGGPYGPYRQSERKEIYKQYYKQLIDNGKAYYAFDTAEDLDLVRSEVENFSYNSETRNSMKNSLTFSKEETEKMLLENNDWVVRIKYPDQPIIIEVDDIIRGRVVVNTSTLDDKVIWKKKDELPTYHLANIVDDHLMKITHVIRGEEWLPSAPLHVYLYDCFGWNAPKFAHLPLILGPNGGKLSKRDGDKYGFSVYPLSWVNPDGKLVEGYKDQGYLPESVINFLAFIGWNPGTEKEIYTMDELIQDFDLKRINKAGGKFNPVKAAWFNGQHLKMSPTENLIDAFKTDLKKRGINKDDDFIYKVVDENKGKVNFIKDLYNVVCYYFEKPKSYDEKVLRKWNENTFDILDGFKDALSFIPNWKEDSIKNVFETYVKNIGIKFGDIIPYLRVVLTGLAGGSSIFDIMEVIGKVGVIDRLSNLDGFGKTSSVEDVKVDNGNNQKIEHLTKELELARTSLNGIESRLSNTNFVSRAPQNVVDGERQKAEELKIKIQEIEKELNS